MTRSTTKLTAREIRELVAQYSEKQKNNAFNYKQVSHALGITDRTQMRTVALSLAEMAFDGDLLEIEPGKFKVPNRTNVTTGRFVRRSNGKNSVITDPDGETISVPERLSMHALNGDKVKVIVSARRRGADPEAQVVEILEKKEQTFIGRLQVDKHVAFLVTDSKYLATDIIIPRKSLRGAKTGDKVVVAITNWPEYSKNPTGTIVDILGRDGEHNAEMHAILAEYGLPYRYPENVEKEAAKIGAGITPEEVAKRVDLRGVTTFTIDPRDAKDFDDALSIRPLKGGRYEVGVHIADVTHYVEPSSIINREAEKRATSVYLVDRVVPMLPEHLSNGICSLRPDEDKLTFSVLFEMDRNGRVYSHRICRTVTRSVRRFTYEEAQEVIETGHGDYAKEILTLDAMAKQLRKRRYEDGAVDFDRAEVRFEIDDNGHPVDVFFKESKDSNKLIEEFMLLANRTVATAVGGVKPPKKAKSFVYRVHEMPDLGKLAELARTARVFGYKVRETGTPREVNRSINRMLEACKGKGEENLLALLAVRAMAKAEYSTDNVGHYGLGFEYYTHFTSPIRRYPDMMVHRLLARYMDGGRSYDHVRLEEKCKHSSEMEQLAANAERSSIKYKQVEYMADRLGEVYDGVISSVTEWGFYVELIDNKCEGLVPVRDLADDYYDFDESRFCLVGRRHNVRYTLGDQVRVRVARANLERKQLDFALVDDRTLDEREDHLGRKVSAREAWAMKNKRQRPDSRRRHRH